MIIVDLGLRIITLLVITIYSNIVGNDLLYIKNQRDNKTRWRRARHVSWSTGLSVAMVIYALRMQIPPPTSTDWLHETIPLIEFMLFMFVAGIVLSDYSNVRTEYARQTMPPAEAISLPPVV